MHLLRIRKPPAKAQPTDGKPYRITIHAHGDQWQTLAMGPGDSAAVENIAIHIRDDGTIHAWPTNLYKATLDPAAP